MVLIDGVKIKPCPFCGESERIDFGIVSGYGYVECKNCSAEIRARGTERDAAEAWNRRAESCGGENDAEMQRL